MFTPNESRRSIALDQLHSDIEKWGDFAMTAKREELRAMLGYGRGDRLYSWVRSMGSQDPRFKHEAAPLREEKSADGERWLVIPDIHVAPGQSYRRLAWAARMASDLKVDRIIQGGDWNSFDSLCEQRSLLERGKDRLRDEILAQKLSLKVFHDNLTTKPRLDIVEGNHDTRPEGMAKKAPWMEGAFDVWKWHRKYGWNITPYKHPLRANGVLFQHYLTARGSGKQISGKYHALRLLERVKYQESVVVFHSHRLQWWSEYSSSGGKHGLVAGCYIEHYEEYAGMDNEEWWSGLTVLNNVRDGNFDPEFWSIERVKDTYGRKDD